jgi:hypothetical protein
MRLQGCLVLCVFVGHAALAATTCNDLRKLSLPQTTIDLADLREPGAFPVPHAKALTDLPSFCRVVAVSKPSTDSEIEFEVWLPATGWNGKFQGAGNGGFAGEINYRGMANAVAHGYATASTDTGHKA